MVRTPAERKQDERARMREAGFILRQVWVHPEDWARVKVFLERTNARRRKAKPPL